MRNTFATSRRCYLNHTSRNWLQQPTSDRLPSSLKPGGTSSTVDRWTHDGVATVLCRRTEQQTNLRRKRQHMQGIALHVATEHINRYIRTVVHRRTDDRVFWYLARTICGLQSKNSGNSCFEKATSRYHNHQYNRSCSPPAKHQQNSLHYTQRRWMCSKHL